MSRNEEKAMGTLNRWTTYRQSLLLGLDGKDKKRPRFARNCTDLQEAMKHRRAMVKDVTEKIEQIQNAGLGEFRLRELNDEINQLLKEKHAWERQVEKLGGPTLSTRGSSGRTYKYFGAAKELPQVRELLAKPVAKKTGRRDKAEILKSITHSYFESVTEDDDPTGLFAEEARRAREVRAELAQRLASEAAPQVDADADVDVDVTDFDRLLLKTVNYTSQAFLSDDEKRELDTAQAMEKVVVERKRRQLLEKYAL